MELTAGTLRPVPRSFMADGQGRVMVLVQISGARADGRSFDNPRVLLFTLDGSRVRSVDQFRRRPERRGRVLGLTQLRRRVERRLKDRLVAA